MPELASEETVDFVPLTRVREDGQWIVGRPETGTFLVLEPAAVEVMDWLAAGLTVGQAERRYRRRHAEAVDLQGFLAELAEKGFLASAAATPQSAPRARRFHLRSLSPALARRLFGGPTLVATGLLVTAALVALVARPELVPGWQALYFPRGLGLYGGILLAASLAAIALHELAHLTAARAVGVACRFGLGNRLWIPVAETDMTGVWAVERRKRYLPFLAGPIVDAASASLLVLALYGQARGWIRLPHSLERFASAMLLIYLLSLLWQCYFFVRTDFYYVLANLLRCKNLMADTRELLARSFSALLPGADPPAPRPLPAHERRAARWFAPVWLGGRALAIAVLVTIQLPLAWSYLQLLAGAVGGAGSAAPAAGGGLGTAVIAVVGLGTGLTLWIYQLTKRTRKR